jgi:hypothetical protein
MGGLKALGRGANDEARHGENDEARMTKEARSPNDKTTRGRRSGCQAPPNDGTGLEVGGNGCLSPLGLPEKQNGCGDSATGIPVFHSCFWLRASFVIRASSFALQGRSDLIDGDRVEQSVVGLEEFGEGRLVDLHLGAPDADGAVADDAVSLDRLVGRLDAL